MQCCLGILEPVKYRISAYISALASNLVAERISGCARFELLLSVFRDDSLLIGRCPWEALLRALAACLAT